MTPISASKKLLSMAGELRRHPREWPYALRWLHSLLPGHSPLYDQMPWITFRAIDWLAAYLKPDMAVFEYGAGGSTLYLAKRVRSVVSVEHDEGFYQLVRDYISEQGVRNCELLLRKPTPCTDADLEYASHQGKHQGFCFESYVKVIDQYPDASFDLVMVDGRARVACLKRAIAKVKPGGVVMLDNSDRPAYGDSARLLARLSRSDLAGITPWTLAASQTSVWRAPQ